MVTSKEIRFFQNQMHSHWYLHTYTYTSNFGECWTLLTCSLSDFYNFIKDKKSNREKQRRGECVDVENECKFTASGTLGKFYLWLKDIWAQGAWLQTTLANIWHATGNCKRFKRNNLTNTMLVFHCRNNYFWNWHFIIYALVTIECFYYSP